MNVFHFVAVCMLQYIRILLGIEVMYKCQGNKICMWAKCVRPWLDGWLFGAGCWLHHFPFYLRNQDEFSFTKRTQTIETDNG